MNRKFHKYLGLALLLASSLPFSLVYAETVEEVPTGETTISSMADDPLKEYKEKAANQVSTIEGEPETEASEDKAEVKSEEDTPTSESSKEGVPVEETKPKPKPQPRGGGGIGPQAVNLIEGVDIDADFAQLLRTGTPHPSWMYGVTNSGFTGYGKAPNTLTDDDMKTLTYLNAHAKQLNGIRGIEYAINLEELSCGYNKFASLDLSQNTKIKKVTSSGNTPLANIDVTNCTDLEHLEVKNIQLTNIDLSKNVKLETLIIQGTNLTSIDLSKNIELKKLECMSPISVLDVTNNPKIISLTAYVTGTSLDLTSNIKLEYLVLSGSNVEHLDLTFNTELKRFVNQRGKLKTLNVSNSTKLNYLDVSQNQLTTLDLTDSVELTYVNCAWNQLSDLDLGYHPKLTNILCALNQLTTIDVSNAPKLSEFRCNDNKLSSLDVDNNTELKRLYCGVNDLHSLNVSNNLILEQLECNSNEIMDLDLSGLDKLVGVSCSNNKLDTLILQDNDVLKGIDCSNNNLSNLDIAEAKLLETLYMQHNKFTNFSASANPTLKILVCNNNQLVSLDVTNATALTQLNCSYNKLASIDLSKAIALQTADLSYNELETIDITANNNLKSLNCQSNHISDITKAYNPSFMKGSDIRYQTIFVPVPSVENNQATLEKLKTTNQQGLSIDWHDIPGSPILTPNGDNVDMLNVTRDTLTNKSVGFRYDNSQILAGLFDGTITFYTVSELGNHLKPSSRKVKNGDIVEWTWTISSITTKDAENIHATLTLPSGLALQAGSITIDGSPGTISDIDGTNNLGDLSQNQSIIVKFTTKVTGSADEWFEPKGRLDWEDDTINSPHWNERAGEIQVLDEEQTYTPKSNSMGILSVPIYFNYGVKSLQTTAQTYGLDASDFQSNTNVVTDGFYTRIKDTSYVSTGWKLTAKLSNFESYSQVMPNSVGASLKFENMSIERVTDQDTPQEVIDPSPSGADVPSSVQATETLVAGQPTAKTLVSAQPNEGQDTWQLRMPFDKISLNLPANAGKKGTVYKAKLTWSLDDTP